ncbi:T-complex protein 1 subunit delta [Nymphaea thermarum]|nr:T-complex protein 1 subunit delta [Nymphaea thermarum]
MASLRLPPPVLPCRCHHRQGRHCLANRQEAWGNRQQRQAALPVILSDHDAHSGSLILDQKASHAAGGPTRMENAKITVIQFQISPPKTDIEHSILVSDYTQMDRIPKQSLIKKIKATGCNVLLIQNSLHIPPRRSHQSLTALLIKHFHEEKLGFTEQVKEIFVGEANVVKITARTKPDPFF